MKRQDFEKDFMGDQPETDPEKLAEAIKFLYEQMRESVRNICDIVISRYDKEIMESKINIEKSEKKIADAVAAIRELEVRDWQNGLD